MTEKYTLTEEHGAQLQPWADKWIANSVNCEPTTEDDMRVAREAIRGLYVANDLAPPPDELIILVRSPLAGAIACTISSGVRWLRDNPERQAELFGEKLSNDGLLRAAMNAAPTAAKDALVLNGASADKAAQQHGTIAAEARTIIGHATWDGPATGCSRELASIAARQDSSPLSAAAEKAASFLVLCVQYWGSFYNGGNQWSGWPAFLSFFRHVAKLPIDYSKWQHYETAAAFGPRFMHEKFCLLSDRPELIHRDEQNRPHCDNGPFCKWRDGWELYYLHGVRVTERIVMDPESYTAEEIQAEKNSEVVRALGERLGWDRFVEKLGAVVINKWVDPNTGLDYELLELPHKWGEAQPRFLKMRSPELNDGSKPYYIEAVDPRLQTAQAARKWGLADWKEDDADAFVEHCNADSVMVFAKEA